MASGQLPVRWMMLGSSTAVRSFPCVAALGLAVSLTVAGPAAAHEIEVGGSLAVSHASQVTHTEICTAVGCGAATVTPAAGRVAPGGSFIMRVPVLSRVALRSDLALTSKGYSPPTMPYVRATYIEMATVVDLTILSASSVALGVSAGLAPAVRATCEVRGDTTEGELRTGCGQLRHGRPVGPGVLDLGAVVGVGLRLDLGAGTAFAEWRNVQGIVDVSPGASGFTRNVSQAVMMGYMVRLGAP